MPIRRFVLAILICFTFSATITAQTKDSVFSENKVNGIWQKTELDIITRNNLCAIVSVLQLRWTESSRSWTNALLVTYDSVQGINRIFTQSWDTLSNRWVNYSRALLTYRKEGSQQIYQYQIWDAVSSLWINNYRLIDNRDNEGRSVISEVDIYSGNAWQKLQRNLLSYNASNRVTQSIFQTWNNAWTNNNKSVYDYSSGITLNYLWDMGNMKWTKFTRTLNDYLDSTVLAEKSFTQSYSGSGWQNTQRLSATYNDDDQQLFNLQQLWDANTQAWVNASRITMSYYDDGNQNHFVFEGWDATSNSWSYGYRSASTDISCSETIRLIPMVQNNKENLLHPAPGAKAAPDKIIERKFNLIAGDRNTLVYDFSLNGDQSQQYAFELILSSAQKQQKVNSQPKSNAIAKNNTGFMVSPNPAKNYFDVNLPAYKNTGSVTLKLSDISGKTILQQKMNAGIQRVHLPSLQKGMYIVTITSGKESQNQKLVIE